MTYIDGFLLAVPEAGKEAYRKLADEIWPVFQRLGALAMVEGWGDDVPDGDITSINAAVQRKEGEIPLFSWTVWPDKAVRDRAWQEMMSNPSAHSQQDMPFDGSRMIYGGFDLLVGDPLMQAGYINGTVMPVQADQRTVYERAAGKVAEIFREHGALMAVDCWSDDLPEGKVNDFYTAVDAQGGEAIIFSWVGWADKEAHDRGWEKIMSDPRMEEFGPQTAGGDLQRMIFGSFVPLVDNR